MQPLTIYLLHELTPEFLCRLKDYLSNKFENLGIYTLGGNEATFKKSYHVRI